MGISSISPILQYSHGPYKPIIMLLIRSIATTSPSLEIGDSIKDTMVHCKV